MYCFRLILKQPNVRILSIYKFTNSQDSDFRHRLFERRCWNMYTHTHNGDCNRARTNADETRCKENRKKKGAAVAESEERSKTVATIFFIISAVIKVMRFPSFHRGRSANERPSIVRVSPRGLTIVALLFSVCSAKPNNQSTSP